MLKKKSHTSVSIRTALRGCGSKRGVMVHIMTLTSVWFFSTFFPQCSPVNLNKDSLIVYNHIDAVIMCCEWDPHPPCILEGDKVTFFIITCDALFWGNVHWSLGREDKLWLWFFFFFYFQYSKYNNTVEKGANPLWVQFFCQGQALFFGQSR